MFVQIVTSWKEIILMVVYSHQQYTVCVNIDCISNGVSTRDKHTELHVIYCNIPLTNVITNIKFDGDSIKANP